MNAVILGHLAYMVPKSNDLDMLGTVGIDGYNAPTSFELFSAKFLG